MKSESVVARQVKQSVCGCEEDGSSRVEWYHVVSSHDHVERGHLTTSQLTTYNPRQAQNTMMRVLFGAKAQRPDVNLERERRWRYSDSHFTTSSRPTDHPFVHKKGQKKRGKKRPTERQREREERGQRESTVSVPASR